MNFEGKRRPKYKKSTKFAIRAFAEFEKAEESGENLALEKSSKIPIMYDHLYLYLLPSIF